MVNSQLSGRESSVTTIPLSRRLNSEFLSSKDYAGRYEFVTITSGEPTNEDIYQGALRLFEILSNKILSIKAPLQGTHVFKEIKLSDYIVDSPREKKSL